MNLDEHIQSKLGQTLVKNAKGETKWGQVQTGPNLPALRGHGDVFDYEGSGGTKQKKQLLETIGSSISNATKELHKEGSKQNLDEDYLHALGMAVEQGKILHKATAKPELLKGVSPEDAINAPVDQLAKMTGHQLPDRNTLEANGQHVSALLHGIQGKVSVTDSNGKTKKVWDKETGEGPFTHVVDEVYQPQFNKNVSEHSVVADIGDAEAPTPYSLGIDSSYRDTGNVYNLKSKSKNRARETHEYLQEKFPEGMKYSEEAKDVMASNQAHVDPKTASLLQAIDASAGGKHEHIDDDLREEISQPGTPIHHDIDEASTLRPFYNNRSFQGSSLDKALVGMKEAEIGDQWKDVIESNLKDHAYFRGEDGKALDTKGLQELISSNPEAFNDPQKAVDSGLFGDFTTQSRDEKTGVLREVLDEKALLAWRMGHEWLQHEQDARAKGLPEGQWDPSNTSTFGGGRDSRFDVGANAAIAHNLVTPETVRTTGLSASPDEDTKIKDVTVNRLKEVAQGDTPEAKTVQMFLDATGKSQEGIDARDAIIKGGVQYAPGYGKTAKAIKDEVMDNLGEVKDMYHDNEWEAKQAFDTFASAKWGSLKYSDWAKTEEAQNVPSKDRVKAFKQAKAQAREGGEYKDWKESPEALQIVSEGREKGKSKASIDKALVKSYAAKIADDFQATLEGKQQYGDFQNARNRIYNLAVLLGGKSNQEQGLLADIGGDAVPALNFHKQWTGDIFNVLKDAGLQHTNFINQNGTPTSIGLHEQAEPERGQKFQNQFEVSRTGKHDVEGLQGQATRWSPMVMQSIETGSNHRMYQTLRDMGIEPGQMAWDAHYAPGKNLEAMIAAKNDALGHLWKNADKMWDANFDHWTSQIKEQVKSPEKQAKALEALDKLKQERLDLKSHPENIEELIKNRRYFRQGGLV